ncbi:electron transport complex subunit RsxE [Miniphocaeibacter halophilus]|uniref:Electron transport complex subunit E n=1 Tax=Miniphocaeibacter halophilus TaxID=2931922 RepID=A0AC61MRQ4_9FIRM|nr:electron transport complex subunit E [Miniphocaeibacter halophilus]QQK07144.1 electron transport complex subunit E [Miniphocaeibacter halophilus]
MSIKKLFKDGIIKNNPVLIQLVGLCSVLGVSTSVINALGMGISLMVVLTLSNLVISLLRNFIPDDIRIPCYIVVIATFVTVVDMVIKAYLPPLYDALGIFIPLIVVNCIILARAEGFASSHGPLVSIMDGIANGIGYTVVITILAFFREVLGAGSIFGYEFLSGETIKPIGIIAQAPGSFILLGCILATFNFVMSRKEKKAKEDN